MSEAAIRLTPAQRRILEKASFGPCIFRGRHGPAIDALKKKGLVDYDCNFFRGVTPGLTGHTEYTVRCTKTGREFIRTCSAPSTEKGRG